MKFSKLAFPNDLNNSTICGLAIVVVIVLLSIAVPLFSPYDPVASAGEALAVPSRAHFFGTDQLGRDVFTRTFASGRLDLMLALIGVSAPFAHRDPFGFRAGHHTQHAGGLVMADVD